MKQKNIKLKLFCLSETQLFALFYNRLSTYYSFINDVIKQEIIFG